MYKLYTCYVEKTTGVAVNLSVNGRFVAVVPSYQGFPLFNAITNHSFDTNTLDDQQISKINDLIVQSISVCDVNLRSSLYNNIFLMIMVLGLLSTSINNMEQRLFTTSVLHS